MAGDIGRRVNPSKRRRAVSPRRHRELVLGQAGDSTSQCLGGLVRVHHGRLPARHLPNRQRSFASEHGKCLAHFQAGEGTCSVCGAADDAGSFEDVRTRRTALNREHHPRSVGPKLVRQRADLALEAVPPRARLRVILIYPARHAGAVLTQDAGRFGEHRDRRNPAAGRARST